MFMLGNFFRGSFALVLFSDDLFITFSESALVLLIVPTAAYFDIGRPHGRSHHRPTSCTGATFQTTWRPVG